MLFGAAIFVIINYITFTNRMDKMEESSRKSQKEFDERIKRGGMGIKL